MKKLILLSLVLLTACAHDKDIVKPEPVAYKHIEYVIRIPPKETLEIPEQVPSLNVDSAKQSDIAKWILNNEERMRLLENKIIQIASFFRLEQDKLAQQAAEENKKSAQKAVEEQAARATKNQ